MSLNAYPATSLDRFVDGRAAQIVAFAWGFAEATLFFIVPDVPLTGVGCRSLRAGLKAMSAALVGALLGGMLMYNAGAAAPETTIAELSHPRQCR